MILKHEELVSGNIYFYSDSIIDYKAIFQFIPNNHPDDLDMGDCLSYGNHGNDFYHGGWLRYTDAKELRSANNLEKAWLDACIKANEVVPLNKIQVKIDLEINNYEIY